MNKRTLVVLMGFRNGKMYQTLLIILGTLSLLVWILSHATSSLSALALIPAAAQCFLLIKVWQTQNPAALDSELKKVALLTFGVSLVLALV